MSLTPEQLREKAIEAVADQCGQSVKVVECVVLQTSVAEAAVHFAEQSLRRGELLRELLAVARCYIAVYKPMGGDMEQTERLVGIVDEELKEQ